MTSIPATLHYFYLCWPSVKEVKNMYNTVWLLSKQNVLHTSFILKTLGFFSHKYRFEIRCTLYVYLFIMAPAAPDKKKYICIIYFLYETSWVWVIFSVYCTCVRGGRLPYYLNIAILSIYIGNNLKTYLPLSLVKCIIHFKIYKILY